MAYTIKNALVYGAAFAGAMAGMTNTSIGNGQSPALAAGYSVTANAAFAYAQALDTQAAALPLVQTGTFVQFLIEALSEETFRDRNPAAVTNANLAATWTGLANDVLAAVSEAVTVSNAGTTTNITGPNFASITVGATTNGQGSGGPTIVALLQIKALYTGIFDYSISGVQAAAAATEVVTWTVTSQTGTGAVTTTGGGNAPGMVGSGTTTGPFLAQVGTAAAGTGIAVTAGGGGELTQFTSAETVGTAGVGNKVGASGILQNSVTSLASTGTLVPFPLGSNVFLLLKITNSATNRVVSSINMSLSERTSV